MGLGRTLEGTDCNAGCVHQVAAHPSSCKPGGYGGEMISPKCSQEKEGIAPHRGAQRGASWGHFECLWTPLSVVYKPSLAPSWSLILKTGMLGLLHTYRHGFLTDTHSLGMQLPCDLWEAALSPSLALHRKSFPLPQMTSSVSPPRGAGPDIAPWGRWTQCTRYGRPPDLHESCAACHTRVTWFLFPVGRSFLLGWALHCLPGL